MLILSDSAFYSLLKSLVEKKGLIPTCSAIGHQSTSRVERWLKENKIPDAHKFKVMELFAAEGILK